MLLSNFKEENVLKKYLKLQSYFIILSFYKFDVDLLSAQNKSYL